MKADVNLIIAIAAALSPPASYGAFAEGCKGQPPLLTPKTMERHGFSIRFRFTEQTVTEGSLPTRPTGVLQVDVVFDAERGPTIKKIDRIVLLVRDADKRLLGVPVRTSSKSGAMRVGGLLFSIHKDWTAKTRLLLIGTGEGKPAEFEIDVGAFYKASRPDGGRNRDAASFR